MLDQLRIVFFNSLGDFANDDLNAAAAVIAYVGLKRFTPATVEQRSDSGHARCWRCILGAGDASQDLDAHLGVSAGQ